MHGLVKCKHVRRCSRARGVDVSFRDVTIKIPYMWVTSRTGSVAWDLKKSQLVEFCGRKKKVDFRLLAEALGRCCTLFGADGKVVIERWYLSPYVEKPLNSKVMKSFVPELRSRKCFLCFRIPMLYIYIYIYMSYEHSMIISHIHVWLCYTWGSLIEWVNCKILLFT